MPIAKLPPLLVNQIAAGEVVDRPASVVKELVENSLDAAAGRIDIVVEDGGRQLIRISDDGAGIAADQLPLAVAAHATSKLQAAEDLAAINTLGFRGEALASIASISRLRITSRATIDGAAAPAGCMIDVCGDQVGQPAPAASAPGTVVEVRDLFVNTPARRKFMRSASTEYGHIADAVLRIAMAWPHVGFTLSHNARATLDLPPTQSPADRCAALLGKDIAPALLEFSSSTPPGQPAMAVWGLAGLPSVARSSSRFQYVLLNGRAVRDRNIAHAIREAYRGLIPHDRHPLAVVMLTLDPAAVDVNVHPTKSEVRFGEPSRVHGLVLSAIRQRLLESDLTPNISAAPHVRPAAEPADTATGRPTDSLLSPLSPACPSDPSLAGPQTTAASAGGDLSANSFVDYFRRMDPKQKGFVYQQVKRALADEGGDVDPPDEPTLPLRPRIAEQSVLQVHKSYLVTQDEHGLLIVDQHALHERVMFEQLAERVIGKGKRLESQRLLMPVVIETTPKRVALAEEIGPLLERIGIEAAAIGPACLAIYAFATFLFERNVEPDQFIDELLTKAEEGELAPNGADPQGFDEAVLHKVLDMMACKAAVKAGDQLGPAELAELLARREEVSRSSNCPHGRPTTVRLTLRDLEKHFKRT